MKSTKCATTLNGVIRKACKAVASTLDRLYLATIHS